MKKTLFKLLGCCLLAVMASCGESETTETTTTVADTMVVAPQTDATDALTATPAPPPPCAGCEVGTLCSDACLNNIQGCHSISDSEFTERTSGAGYSGTGYNPHGTVAKLCAVINAAKCDSVEVVLDDEPGTANNNNSKIKLTFQPLRDAEKVKDVPVYYRLSLLRSICRDAPKSILFHKASHPSGVVDIVIAVKAQDDSMKYFDLSDAPSKRNKTK